MKVKKKRHKPPIGSYSLLTVSKERQRQRQTEKQIETQTETHRK